MPERLTEDLYDACIWNESVYYTARLPLTKTYDLLGKIMDKLKVQGLLVIPIQLICPRIYPNTL